MNTAYPTTIQEAVHRVLEWPWAKDQNQIDLLRGIGEHGLFEFHFSLGMAIRNGLGLWGENHALLRACGVTDPDDASYVVLKAVRAHLRASATPEEMGQAENARRAHEAEQLKYRQEEAMKDAAITDRRCTQCGMPCPRYRKTCKACGYEMGREP